MNREEAREYMRVRAREYLKPDKSGRGYICPVPSCRSGSGKSGTGITTKDGIHFTCWKGCFMNADIIDIIGLVNNIPESDYNGKLEAAAREFGITIDSGRSAGAADHGSQRKPGNQNQPGNERKREAPAQAGTRPDKGKGQPEADYTEFLLQAEKDIEKTDYHRGLSLETLKHFRIGFCDAWKHPKAPKMEASPRLIIPTSRYSYLARYAGKGDFINYRGQKENKSKVGKVRIFNRQAITTAEKPIFIVEGEIDAMSIYEAGGEAVGLGSISYIKLFLQILEERKPKQPFIISLDNEPEPEKREIIERATRELSEGLERLGIHFYRADISTPHKDANEALLSDPEAFRETIRRAMEKVEEAEAAALEAEREELRREAAAYALPDFLADIENSKRKSAIETGFDNIDAILDGGLYAGLYIIGAISSLGKTTFCLQMADQIAAAGTDVIIFSLEMARNELIAKSISRLTFIKATEDGAGKEDAKTTRGILAGERYPSYSRAERELISQAIESYKEYAKNIFIVEGVGNVGTEQIRARVKRHIKITGKRPVILIDYLQIIAPADIRATDKQNTDKAVLELKRLSRDFGIPVIGISSFNRDNYKEPVNLASFKESGAIEYSSDVLIGLQYDGMDYKEGERVADRDKRIREVLTEAAAAGKEGRAQRIQAKVLKHRNGSKGSAFLEFYPAFNYFEEAEGAEEPGAQDWTPAKSTHEKERERLENVFEEIRRPDGTAEFQAFFERMDMGKRKLKSMLREYGFIIDGETVKIKTTTEKEDFRDAKETPFD